MTTTWQTERGTKHLKTQIIAHRGASAYAPENTMPAYEMACDMKADAIEIDVHFSKDGKVVVVHDDTVERTAGGHGAVNQLTYDALLELDFSNGKAGYKNVKIPLLDEVFEFAARNNIFVHAEIKENTYDNGFPIIEKVLELERKYGMSENVSYSSFNHFILRDLKEVSPLSSTGLLYMCAMVNAWDYAAIAHANAIHPLYLCLDNTDTVSGCHKNGIAVNAWTVDTEEAMRQMLNLAVDGIISNKPDVVRQVMEQFKSE